MTYKQVATMINGTGLPFAYYEFTEQTAKAPPFICFYYSGDDDMKADNANYQRIRTLVLELYTDNKDFETEETVEAALNAAGLVYSRAESYIDTEQMYMVVYTTDIIITESAEETPEVPNNSEEDNNG